MNNERSELRKELESLRAELNYKIEENKKLRGNDKEKDEALNLFKKLLTRGSKMKPKKSLGI